MRQRHWRRAGAAMLAFAAGLMPAAAGAADIKIATWNLNWLTTRPYGDPALPPDVHPRAPADFARLRGYADKLGADVVALQEVDGAPAAALLFPPSRYAVVTIDEAVVQRVGLAIDRRLRFVRNADVSALDPTPDAPYPLRDGLDVTVFLPAPLRLLVVHLKTGCHTDALPSRRPACREFAAQLRPLADWVAARQAEGVAFAVLGDFNREMDQPEALGQTLGRAGQLTRVTAGHSDPCWGGGAFIDHIFLGNAARQWLEPDSLRVLTYRDADPADKERLSDHCPVSVRLAPPGGREEARPGGSAPWTPAKGRAP